MAGTPVRSGFAEESPGIGPIDGSGRAFEIHCMLLRGFPSQGSPVARLLTADGFRGERPRLRRVVRTRSGHEGYTLASRADRDAGYRGVFTTGPELELSRL